MEFAQLADYLETKPDASEPVCVASFPGTWVNSNPDTTSIARLEISESGGNLWLRAFAIGPDGLIDWGLTDVKVFTAGPSARTGAGFTSAYDFGFAETRMQAMIMKGLLVLTQFHSFKDGSKRSNYFVREYFGLDHGRF